MGDLVVVNSIDIWTQTGPCVIELLYGDITTLKKEDAVDIVMVSAFPGDYAAIPNTAIGALQRKCGISVQDLSFQKEIDFRSKFSCWLSKPLHKEQSYGRLLCFERRRFEGTVVNQIREMFRGFTPIFNNKDTTIITPLLATGNQGKSQSQVLIAMVESAANWAMAGLPLRLIKIVVYQRVDDKLEKLFEDLKKRFEKISKKEQNKSLQRLYDVLIIFDQNDYEWVEKILLYLKAKKQDIKVNSVIQTFEEEKVWQDSISKSMHLAYRVVIVLTPTFVSKPECLEQFNMAMCYNRLRKGNFLMPFYMDTVENMPIYMTLVQYHDCRERKVADNINQKIEDACGLIVSNLSEQGKKNISAIENKKPQNFDVFISYSHKNPDKAKSFMDSLLKENKNLKIFFDRSELKMGNLWQETLYSALECTKCVIALISESYMSSVVCQEEYNIALYRQITEGTDLLFIPVLIDETDLCIGFKELEPLNGVGWNFSETVNKVSRDVYKWLFDDCPAIYHQIYLKVNFNEDDFQNRRAKLTPVYKLNDHKSQTMIRPVRENQPKVNEHLWCDRENEDTLCDVAISFGSDATQFGMLLENELKACIPNLKVKFLWENNDRTHHDLDSAKQIVTFLSEDFMKSETHMHNLHIALCRERSVKNKRLLHVVQTCSLIPYVPLFPRLLYIDTCFEDKKWLSLQGMAHKKADFKKHNGDFSGKTFTSTSQEFGGTYSTSLANYFATLKVVDDILDNLHKETPDPQRPNLMNVLCVKHVAQTGKRELPMPQKLSSNGSTTKSQHGNNKTNTSTDEKSLAHQADKQITQNNDQKDRSVKEGTKSAIEAKESSCLEKSVTDKKTENQESESKPQAKCKQEVKSDPPHPDKQNMRTEKSRSKSCIVL